MSEAAQSTPPTDLPYNPDKPFFACDSFELDYFKTAPVRFQYTKELPCSAAQLFESFEDPKSWPKWATGIGKVIWTSPKPYKKGTTRTVVFWGGIEVYEDFMIFDSPREMAFRFYGHSEKLWHSFGEHYKVEGLGPKSCRLTWSVAYNPTGRLALPGITPIMKISLGSFMWRLGRYIKKRY